jgi:5,10-methylene-tetrahydrofolate dehydrogenase/methenyl tetrahydrofolate cyclohydrolase
MTLGIYYDNPNEASDMYLKWLKKDCEANEINVEVIDNFQDWISSESDAELFLEPIKDDRIKCMRDNNPANVDSPSATAQGIYNYITKNYPSREENILVIGRGLVGKQLIDKLIDYGYTVLECNSQTPIGDLRQYTMFMHIVVGLANQDNILDADWCDRLYYGATVLIDSGNNFDTKNKLRCGKWTRDVIIQRIKELGKGENEV